MADPACEVWFYHMERSSLEQVLPDLLERSLARNWRAIVRGRQSDRIERLDELLWTYRDESFLPHGLAEEPHAALQPVILTTQMDNPNGADVVFLLDGADAGDLDGFVRCIVLFDGRDEAALATARAQWRAIKTSGLPVSYWKQMARGWEKQA
ncbi:MAG: DNA polymerase III subunit chi [Phenylobacterium sp.]|uniref:DNA polymerase III subunit chi n=1 Tax=Phenylobacterium sp. TaxID=1871053 RepID=UPI00271F1458|nr:DNA polymerase III subunit chi [Phenylobacterium sp.]MDO8900882.1 DNA polymerase III subunit chi [Phenylobacterium sp.]